MKTISVESINISTFKAHLSEVIERVKNGASLQIMERTTPVAYLTQLADATTLRVAQEPKGKIIAPLKFNHTNIVTDPVEMLIEDRRRR